MLPAKRSGWLPSIFNDFFGNEWLERSNITSPAVNIIEGDKEYKVEVAAPGMTKDDIKIDFQDNNELTITMEKKTEKKEDEDKKGKYLRREFSYSHFRQSMILPDDIMEDKIEAKVENGVLTINIPKKKVEEQNKVTKNIEIK